jgi:hypothetical protein
MQSEKRKTIGGIGGNVGWRYDTLRALNALCQQAVVSVQTLGYVHPDLAATLAAHAAALDTTLGSASLDEICRATALMLQSAAKEGGEEGGREAEAWTEKGERGTRTPALPPSPSPSSPLGLFETLPPEIVSKILQHPGARRLATASGSLRERVAAEDVWERRRCERAAAEVALPLEALCIDANPEARCAKVCGISLAKDPRAFLAGLLRAAVLMLGVNPDTAAVERPIDEMWWPLTPRAGPLARVDGVLAFLPVLKEVMTPQPSWSDRNTFRIVTLRLALQPRDVPVAVAEFSVRPAVFAAEDISARWVMHKMLSIPRYPPHHYLPLSGLPPWSGAHGEERWSLFGSNVTVRHTEHMTIHEERGLVAEDWDAVTAQLAGHAEKAMRLWASQPLYIEVEFPGWLHIVRADATDLREWVALMRAAFDPLALGGALPVARADDSRDGVLTVEAGKGVTVLYLTPHVIISTPPHDIGEGISTAEWWPEAIESLASNVFYQSGGHVQLPRPGYYVTMHASLRFAFPHPIPPRGGGGAP